MVNTPAGWYPQEDGQQRYWDGEKWTEHFAPTAQQPVTSPQGSAASPPPEQTSARPWFKKKRFVIPAVLVGLVIVGSALGSLGGDTTTTASKETSSTAPSSATKPTATTGEPTAAATKAPAPAPAPAPEPDLASFDGSGTFEVGSDVKPGLYRSGGGGYWERLKDATGDLEAIIANDNPTGQAYVQIAKGDGYFSTTGNEEWVMVDTKADGDQATTFSGDGMYMVGVDIKPGTYKAAGSGYWARLNDAGGDLDTIIANDNPAGNAIVKITKTDKFFSTSGMEEWTLTQ